MSWEGAVVLVSRELYTSGLQEFKLGVLFSYVQGISVSGENGI